MPQALGNVFLIKQKTAVKKFIKSLYLNPRFFLYIILNVLVLILGNFWELFFVVGKMAIVIFVALILIDTLLLYNTSKKSLTAHRDTPTRLSNGDDNHIKLSVSNNLVVPVFIKIIDEIPFRFQVRDFEINDSLRKNEEKHFQYTLRPVERGSYSFGKLNIYAKTKLGLISRRFTFSENAEVPVYPSFITMRKYELLAISNRLTEAGIKKIRRISNNREFEQIREYVKGDDYKILNWKATARRRKLMVNQYQDEKSQQVYSIIDMGRTMKMPFEKMSLLDYAINASLVISKIAILKKDKAGLLTFSKDIHNVVPASRKNTQMETILQTLYKQETNYLEANYQALYASVRRNITKRSLLLLYTNFEGLSSLNRQLEFFKLLAKNHLLVVIFFENTEVKKLVADNAKSVEDIYVKTIAEKFSYEKRQIVKELHKYGIHSILTEPKNLTVNTINKYLQLKSAGLI